MDALGIFLTIFLLLVGSMMISCIFIWLKHCILCRRERDHFKPRGELIDVGDHRQHTVVYGVGQPTLVLMASGGTSCPELDFRYLSKMLAPFCALAITEHAGSGYSDDTHASRDVDTLLQDDRKALSAAGAMAPYVLCAHSMAGIEALRWAQKYPEEILAVVGIDMAVPQVYYHSEVGRVGSSLGGFLTRMGVMRLLPQLVDSQPQITDGKLSSVEKEEFRALFYQQSASAAARKEAAAIWQNAKLVQEVGIPDIPMLLMVSNGKWISLQDGLSWRDIQREFASHLCDAELEYYDCSHYIHQYLPEEVAERIRRFLDRVANGDRR